MIAKKYTLFIRIPIYRSVDGGLFCEQLWAKDLFAHLQYIDDFSICCPVMEVRNTNDLVDVTDWGFKNIYPLMGDVGLRGIFSNLASIGKAVREAEVVHSDAAGWPFPLSFYLLLVRLFCRRKWVVVVESSFWMSSASRASFKGRVKFKIFDTLLKLVLRVSDARVFTSSFYKNYFLGTAADRSLVCPAIWIDQDDVLSEFQVVSRFNAREPMNRLKVVFPSRLVPEKGAAILIDAINILHRKSLPVDICVIGEGVLQSSFVELACQDLGSVVVTYFPPIEYGVKFFEFLRKFDFVLLCNVNEEQPRIIFDAFSQGVPVVAPKTSGVLDVVDSSNAVLYEVGSPESLANALASIPLNIDCIKAAAIAGLQSVAGREHRAMHEAREVFLQEIL